MELIGESERPEIRRYSGRELPGRAKVKAAGSNPAFY